MAGFFQLLKYNLTGPGTRNWTPDLLLRGKRSLLPHAGIKSIKQNKNIITV